MITKQEMIDWIMSQPDDRMVDMSECRNGSKCGCIAVHYANDKNIRFVRASVSTWWNWHSAPLIACEVAFNTFVPNRSWCWVGTYGEIKAYINK